METTTRPLPIAPLAASVFSANLGLAVIFPLIPRLAAEAGAGMVGWAFSSYATCLVFSQIIAGILADRLGAVRVLVVALLLYAAALMGFALVRGLPGIMAVRALEGLAVGAIIPAVMAVVARGVAFEERGSAMGRVGGMGGIGFLIGPVLGERLARFDLAWPFLFTMGVALASCLAVAWTWRAGRFEPAVITGDDPDGLAPGALLKQELGQLGRRLVDPAFLALVVPLFAVKVNFATLQAGLPLYGPRVLGLTPAAIGYLFVLTAVVYVVASPLAGQASDRHPSRTLARGALAVLAALAVVTAPIASTWPFVVAFGLFGLFQSAGYIVTTKYLADGLGTGAIGRGLGLASAIGDVGMILGPASLMPLYAWQPRALWLGMAVSLLAGLGLSLLLDQGRDAQGVGVAADLS